MRKRTKAEQKLLDGIQDHALGLLSQLVLDISDKSGLPETLVGCYVIRGAGLFIAGTTKVMVGDEKAPETISNLNNNALVASPI